MLQHADCAVHVHGALRLVAHPGQHGGLLGGVALLWVHHQQVSDEVLRVLAHVVPLGRGEVELPAQDLPVHQDVVVGGEGRVPAEPACERHATGLQDVGDHADGPDVHGRAVHLPLHDLGRQVAGRAAGGRQPAHRMGLAVSRTQRENLTREAKVGDLDVGVVLLVLQQNVLGLQVAVHDAAVVAVGDGVEQRAHDGLRLALRVAGLADDGVEELAAGAELLHHVEVVVVLVEALDADDVGVLAKQ